MGLRLKLGDEAKEKFGARGRLDRETEKEVEGNKEKDGEKRGERGIVLAMVLIWLAGGVGMGLNEMEKKKGEMGWQWN